MLKQLNVFTANTVAYTTSREIEIEEWSIVIQCGNGSECLNNIIPMELEWTRETDYTP